MNELEVIRKDAIRLAAVVLNLSKIYKPFQEIIGRKSACQAILSMPA